MELEPTPEPHRPSRRAVVVAAVAAFALVVAAVAVLAGRSGSGQRVTLPALPADASSAAPAVASTVAGSGLAAASQAVGGQAPAIATFLANYQLQGLLPALAAHAPGYRLDGGVTQAAATKLAAALGLHAAVQSDQAGWTATDGSHRLTVTKDGTWSYGPDFRVGCAGVMAPMGGQSGIVCSGVAGSGQVLPVPGTSSLNSGAAGAGSSGAVSGTGQTSGPAVPVPASGQVAPLGVAPGNTGSPVQTTVPAGKAGAPVPTSSPAGTITTPAPTPAPLPGSTCVRPPCPANAMCSQVCLPPPTIPTVDLPSSQQADKAVRDLLGRAGVDLTGAVVNVMATPMADYVTVTPTVAGLPTVGMTSSVTLGSKGAVQSAQGQLATPVKLGDYPLVGTTEGFKRLQAGRWIFGGGPRPMLGAPSIAKPEVQLVTGAHIALARTVAGDQRVYLEPVYVFELAGGGLTPSVPAVPDALLLPGSTGPQPPTRPLPTQPLPTQPAPAPAPVLPPGVKSGAPGASPGQPVGSAGGSPSTIPVSGVAP